MDSGNKSKTEHHWDASGDYRKELDAYAVITAKCTNAWTGAVRERRSRHYQQKLLELRAGRRST